MHTSLEENPLPPISNPEKAVAVVDLSQDIPEPSSSDEEWEENILHAEYLNATDPEEKEKLLHKLIKLLTKHALSVYSQLFHETRSDLANKAVHDTIRYLARYEGRNGAKFSTWAHKIIQNVGRKEITKKIVDRKYWNQFDEKIPGEDGEFFLPSEPEEEKAHDRIFLDKIRESLNGEEQTLFDMVLEGRSAAEMAQVLGGTESSVRGKKLRLQEKLVSQYQDKQ